MANNPENSKICAIDLSSSDKKLSELNKLCELCKKEEKSFYLSIPDLKRVC